MAADRETVEAAIVVLEHRRDILTEQIALLDEGARAIDASYGRAVTPATRSVVSLAGAILRSRS